MKVIAPGSGGDGNNIRRECNNGEHKNQIIEEEGNMKRKSLSSTKGSPPALDLFSGNSNEAAPLSYSPAIKESLLHPRRNAG